MSELSGSFQRFFWVRVCLTTFTLSWQTDSFLYTACYFLFLGYRQIQPLPFSFDIVLAILPLFYVGSHFDRFQVKESPFKKFFLHSFLWGLFLIITYAAAPELSTGRVKCIFIPTPVVLYGCTTYEIKIGAVALTCGSSFHIPNTKRRASKSPAFVV